MEYSSHWLNVSRQKLLEDLQSQISKKRYQHVLRVEQTAIELAKLYDVDPEKASIAALMHDFAKELPNQEMLALAKERWDHPALASASGQIWHGFAAATIAQDKYNIVDEDILTAISAHTIGWYEMSPLVQVVYIADYIEPGRDFIGVEKARKYACKNLTKATEYKMTQTLLYLIEEKQAVFLPTVEIYNCWIEQK